MRPELIVGRYLGRMAFGAKIYAAGGRTCALLVAVLALGIAPVSVGSAATFPDLFTVTVRIDPDARDRRADAIRRAMATLLVRVTGRTEAPAYPELAELIGSGPGLVTSYGQLDSERVRVGFNAAAVQSRLTALDWPLWGAERPQLILWAAVDLGSGQRALLSEPTESPSPTATQLPASLEDLREAILDELVEAADERGLPLVLPLNDEQDAQLISFAGVWGGFDELVTLASARYAADFALSARIAVTDLGLHVEWRLVSAQGEVQTLRTSTLREGIDWVADTFALRYSSAGGSHSTRIDVEGVSSLMDYGRVLAYLESLSIIESVDVASFSGDLLRLDASIRGDRAVIDRVFELDGVLEPTVVVGTPDIFRPTQIRFDDALRYRIAATDSAPR